MKHVIETACKQHKILCWTTIRRLADTSIRTVYEWVCSGSLSVTAGSNFACRMDVYLLIVLCGVR